MEATGALGGRATHADQYLDKLQVMRCDCYKPIGVGPYLNKLPVWAVRTKPLARPVRGSISCSCEQQACMRAIFTCVQHGLVFWVGLSTTLCGPCPNASGQVERERGITVKAQVGLPSRGRRTCNMQHACETRHHVDDEAQADPSCRAVAAAAAACMQVHAARASASI
jgi:hypothetical protein